MSYMSQLVRTMYLLVHYMITIIIWNSDDVRDDNININDINNYFHLSIADVPDEKDLETPLEVGSFAWGWMEPPLGEISFVLLCLQYARAQLENLGAKPYTQRYRAYRANRLIKEFPKYNKVVVASFSEGESFTPSPNHH